MNVASRQGDRRFAVLSAALVLLLAAFVTAVPDLERAPQTLVRVAVKLPTEDADEAVRKAIALAVNRAISTDLGDDRSDEESSAERHQIVDWSDITPNGELETGHTAYHWYLPLEVLDAAVAVLTEEPLLPKGTILLEAGPVDGSLSSGEAVVDRATDVLDVPSKNLVSLSSARSEGDPVVTPEPQINAESQATVEAQAPRAQGTRMKLLYSSITSLLTMFGGTLAILLATSNMQFLFLLSQAAEHCSAGVIFAMALVVILPSANLYLADLEAKYLDHYPLGNTILCCCFFVSLCVAKVFALVEQRESTNDKKDTSEQARSSAASMDNFMKFISDTQNASVNKSSWIYDTLDTRRTVNVTTTAMGLSLHFLFTGIEMAFCSGPSARDIFSTASTFMSLTAFAMVTMMLRARVSLGASLASLVVLATMVPAGFGLGMASNKNAAAVAAGVLRSIAAGLTLHTSVSHIIRYTERCGKLFFVVWLILTGVLIVNLAHVILVSTVGNMLHASLTL